MEKQPGGCFESRSLYSMKREWWNVLNFLSPTDLKLNRSFRKLSVFDFLTESSLPWEESFETFPLHRNPLLMLDTGQTTNITIFKVLIFPEIEIAHPKSNACIWDLERSFAKIQKPTYRVILLKKFDSEGCCELVFGLLRSPKASMYVTPRSGANYF